MNRENSPETVKCVILDLDDTLWKGTLLEDTTVSIDPRHRAAVHTLIERGIALSIASKNELAPAREKLEVEGLWHLFVFPKIDYRPKSHNIRKTIEQLQLRAPNIAFVDDNEFNLAEVEQNIDGIQVYHADEWPDLIDLPQFNPKNRSSESASRIVAYKVEEKRKSHKENFDKYEDFLTSCEIECRLFKMNDEYLPRVLELINRTNQLNFTKPGEELSAKDLATRGEGEDSYVLNVRDRFGDHGVVGFVSFDSKQITSLVFSCRIMSMFIENAVIRWTTKKILERGASRVFITSSNPRLASNGLAEEGYVSEGDGIWSLAPENVPDREYSFISFEEGEGIYRKRAVYTSGSKVRLFFKGGCDLQPILSILDGSVPMGAMGHTISLLRKKMPRVAPKLLDLVPKSRPKYEVIDDLNRNGHNEHSDRLVASLLMDNEDRRVIEKLRGAWDERLLDERDFSTRWLDEEYSVFVWSPLMDVIQTSFRIKGTNAIVTWGSYGANLPTPDGYDDTWIANNTESLGLIDRRRFIANLNLVFSRLLERTPDMRFVILTANIYDPVRDDQTQARIERHREVNLWLENLAVNWNNLSLVEINTITESRYTLFRDIRHYDRETYTRIAALLEETIRKGTS